MRPPRYRPRNHYWVVDGSPSKVYSSKDMAYVPVANPAYVAWLKQGNTATAIAQENDLWEVLAKVDPAIVPPEGLSVKRDSLVSNLDATGLTILFNHENRIRTLAGQPQITVAQFKAAIKTLIT